MNEKRRDSEKELGVFSRYKSRILSAAPTLTRKATTVFLLLFDFSRIFQSIFLERAHDGLQVAKKIASDLKSFKLEKHKILRIVNRVNRKCVDAFGKQLIEKRGKMWVFTDFGFVIWGKTREEVETDG